MIKCIKIPAYLLLSSIFLLLSCNKPHSKSEIESAMKLYDHLIQKMDMDSIALLYTPDGDLGNMAHGRDSIRIFLSSFKNVKVLSTASTTKSIEIKGDSAIQAGNYQQVALFSGKDTVNVSGTYTAKWLWKPPYGWQIKSMVTQPAGSK